MSRLPILYTTSMTVVKTIKIQNLDNDVDVVFTDDELRELNANIGDELEIKIETTSRVGE